MYIHGLMVNMAEINCNVAPHYVILRHFLIPAVLCSQFCHSTRFQNVTQNSLQNATDLALKTNFTNETL